MIPIFSSAWRVILHRAVICFQRLSRSRFDRRQRKSTRAEAFEASSMQTVSRLKPTKTRQQTESWQGSRDRGREKTCSGLSRENSITIAKGTENLKRECAIKGKWNWITIDRNALPSLLPFKSNIRLPAPCIGWKGQPLAFSSAT